MSASASGSRGGQPSTTQPIAGPWLSPKLLTRNRVPKPLPDIRALRHEILQHLADRAGRIRRQHADDVVAAVDIMGLGGHTGREVAEQIEASAAHLVESDIAAQWRVQLVPFQ